MPTLNDLRTALNKKNVHPASSNLSWSARPVTTINNYHELLSNPKPIPSMPPKPTTNSSIPTRPATTKQDNYQRPTFEHDKDQWGYDYLYGKRDYQSDVDIWTHINVVIHPKHKEQQEYIDTKDEALYAGIKGIYQTRRSKADIEKIITDYYGDDLKRIESKLDSHGHGFDPLGDLVKNITSILIIAGIAYVGFKFVLPRVRKKI